MTAATLFKLILLLVLLCQPGFADTYDDLAGSASETVIFEGPPLAYIRQVLGFCCDGSPPESTDLERVLRDLDKRLDKVWTSSAYKSGRPIVAKLDVCESGSITNVVILKSSGVKTIDTSLKAVLESISLAESFHSGCSNLSMTLTFARHR